MKSILFWIVIIPCVLFLSCTTVDKPGKRTYNGVYTGEYLNRIAFPVGGIGAGMFCIEGTGAISHMSVRHHPEVFSEPCMFAAISVKGLENGTKVLEGNVPDWKKFGQPNSGLGAPGNSFGLPRFEQVSFHARFPFARIELTDSDLPLAVEMTVWSPFIPTDADNSSLPIGAIEYRFKNTGSKVVDAVFSYNSKNFMAIPDSSSNSIKAMPNGYILSQERGRNAPHQQGEFAIFTDAPGAVIDHCWFRGGWWDPLTMAWNTIKNSEMKNTPAVESGAPGASLFVPVKLGPGEETVIRLMMAWYVPDSELRAGRDPANTPKCNPESGDCFYKPWYSSRFKNINGVVDYWLGHYTSLKKQSEDFRDAFYASTLPAEVLEAVAANLTILKSPTVMRQFDGRMWNWEGCGDNKGSCHGSCTHVWNYAQAVPHLFPDLERTLRNTEFNESQNEEGHQTFRSALPIRPVGHAFHSAADGQLGGIMKVYRDWRISGDKEWLAGMYPLVKKSMDYCIRTWDPRQQGVLDEPHHNTYDIEFWGPDGMCTSFYLGALKAIATMGEYLGDDVKLYRDLCAKGKQHMESELFNGEYFIQKIQWKGLNAPDPTELQTFYAGYSDEAKALLQKEGPKYQYGNGCLSDGVLGAWIASVSGLDNILDVEKTKSHLRAIHQYNLRTDLTDHNNPQRPTFAIGKEGGLLLCTWPKGGKLSLPFVYSDEVWTGIEYQVASHLMLMGLVDEGLEIVRICRDRYDGRVRNPFSEYECGHWYARAMSSYGLLQGLTGIRYDAVDRTLYIDSQIGDFTSFISTATGFGNVGLKSGKPFIDMKYGSMDVRKCLVSGIEKQW